jgi:hypothetical protein
MGASGLGPDASERVVSSFSKFDVSNTRPVNPKEDNEPSLWLGCREGEGIFQCLIHAIMFNVSNAIQNYFDDIGLFEVAFIQAEVYIFFERSVFFLTHVQHLGSNCIYPCDLIPFTRRPLFLVIDSSVSYAFKAGLFTLWNFF